MPGCLPLCCRLHRTQAQARQHRTVIRSDRLLHRGVLDADPLAHEHVIDAQRERPEGGLPGRLPARTRERVTQPGLPEEARKRRRVGREIEVAHHDHGQFVLTHQISRSLERHVPGPRERREHGPVRVQAEEPQRPALDDGDPGERGQSVAGEVDGRDRLERPAAQDTDAVGVGTRQQVAIRVLRLRGEGLRPLRRDLLHHDEVGRVGAQPLDESRVVAVAVADICRDDREGRTFAG